MSVLKTTGLVAGGIAVTAVAGVALFGLSFGSIHLNGILRTEQAKVDRTVFEETPSFTRGMDSEFERLRLEWETTKNLAVCQAIKHRFGAYADKLNPRQVEFLDTLTCAAQ